MHVLWLSKKRSCVAHFSSFWSILEQMTCKFLASKFQVASHDSSQSPNLKLNNVNAIRGGFMATAKLYLDKRASVGLTAPVKVLITHNRKSVFLSLGVKVPIEKWDSQMLCLKGKENRNLQLFIMQKKVEIDEALINIIRRGIPSDMTATQLREMVLKEISPQIESEQLNAEEKKDCFLSRFRRFMENRPTPGTKAIYNDTYKKVVKFSTGNEGLTFDEIDVEWLTSFDSFLSKTMKSKNSKSIHFRNIRAVFNAAITDEVTTNYPFRKFKIKSEETEKRSLSLEQLHIFMSANLEPWMERYRDVFMLLFGLCGINIIDLCHLKEVNDDRVVYRRAKTHKLYSIKVEPEIKSLIYKHKGKDWLLDILDNYGKSQDFNRRLKRGLDAIIAYINKQLPKQKQLPRISSYWARHTWATLASDIDIPIETISAALGHSYGCATTAIYIRFNQKKVDAANRKVLDYVYNGFN